MKHLFVLALMLRVFWIDPCGGGFFEDKCEKSGIVVAGGGISSGFLLVRLDNGKMRSFLTSEITNSKWEEVKP